LGSGDGSRNLGRLGGDRRRAGRVDAVLLRGDDGSGRNDGGGSSGWNDGGRSGDRLDDSGFHFDGFLRERRSLLLNWAEFGRRDGDILWDDGGSDGENDFVFLLLLSGDAFLLLLSLDWCR